MISNKRHQEILDAERAFWQGAIERLLDRIATFQPNSPETPAALALAPAQDRPTVPQHVGAGVPIAPEDVDPYISEFEMDDEKWQDYVEAARVKSPSLDETQNYPVPVDR